MKCPFLSTIVNKLSFVVPNGEIKQNFETAVVLRKVLSITDNLATQTHRHTHPYIFKLVVEERVTQDIDSARCDLNIL